VTAASSFFDILIGPPIRRRCRQLAEITRAQPESKLSRPALTIT
jgi:hypothetical protein